MNPYKALKIYDAAIITKVQKAVLSGPIFELSQFEPHVYAVSGLAFK